MTPDLHFLIVENEPHDARAQRRASVGRSSGETYMGVLQSLAPGARFHRIKPADAQAALPSGQALTGYDGIVLTGSPLHLYDETAQARREVAFMRDVFASGTPAFGSCAGLQVATVAAGGTVRRNANGREAAFARRITPTAAGRTHPLLDGRPACFDAPSIHTDEVEALPDEGTLLASNGVTGVQAAEIRSGRDGVFWGVQYHPEIGLDEVAAALRRDADDLIEVGLARSRIDLEAHADRIDALHLAPERRDLAWQLGLDEQVTDQHRRRSELRNFIEHLVQPRRSARCRA
jgi:GMP synthase (glutamine-hydrolysing)